MKTKKDKILIVFIVFVMCITGIAVGATTYMANLVTYTKPDGTKINVEQALNELYNRNNTYEVWPIWLKTMNEKGIKIIPSSTQTTNMITSGTNSDGCSLVAAFNGVYSSGGYDWRSQWMAVSSVADSYLGYDFQRPVMLYKMELNYSSYESTGQYSLILQGKKEDGTWENVGDEILIDASTSFRTNNYNISNTKFYYAYRIKNNYSQTGHGKQYWHSKGTYALSIGELQFYCIEQ